MKTIVLTIIIILAAAFAVISAFMKKDKHL